MPTSSSINAKNSSSGFIETKGQLILCFPRKHYSINNKLSLSLFTGNVNWGQPLTELPRTHYLFSPNNLINGKLRLERNLMEIIARFLSDVRIFFAKSIIINSGLLLTLIVNYNSNKPWISFEVNDGKFINMLCKVISRYYR